ncbi:MAG: diguanylate cyclase [Pseudomonadota bacterium]
MIDDAKTRFATLKASGMLPSPQGVALAVLELTQRHDASVQDLTHLVQTDPAMAGRILHYANAVHGGSLRHIASLSHAIVFLGLFRVRQIALGFSLVDHYRSGTCNAFPYLGYWTASLATGITAQLVAAQAQCPPDESFTCGLLSSIGRLGLATAFPREYDAILARNLDEAALREAEVASFGLDHAALSAELLEDWGLPEIFHQAVRHHEAPAEAPFPAGSRAQALTNALHFSAKVGQLLTLDDAQRWERVPSLYQAAAKVDLLDTEVPGLVEQVVTQWQDWGRELRLPTREFTDIKQLLSAPPPPSGEGGLAALMIRPMRLALIVQSPELLRRMADTLEAMGLPVEIAANRQAALALLQRNQTEVMLVELPGCDDDAAQTLLELRASVGGQRAYCIALIPESEEAGVGRLMLAGASDYLLFNYTEAALMARLNAAQRVVSLQGAVRAERESVVRSSGEWARNNRRLLQEAHTDPLTRLHNRRYGMDRLYQEWAFSQHSDTPLSCLMLDIDHFKRINDERGHDTGDVVLAQVARVISNNCRKDDVVFRYGGEEFCIVSPATPLRDAIQLGERIVRAVRLESLGTAEQPFHATISVGVAARSAGLRNADMLVAQADRALYAAKQSGRDRVMAARATPAGD